MSRPPGQRSGDRELPAGTHVGRYVLLHRLGRGGMGVVYAAYDPKLDRKVAIKIMRRRGGNDPERSQGRMLREAQALAKLSHPNVVAVHDTGIIEGQIFVAMDYVQGSDVRRWLREKPRSRAAIVDMMAQAGDGLAAAHAAGIVHRDFKPDNVIVGVDGRAQVLDFGLARVRSETDDGGAGTATPASTDRADAHAGRRPAGTPAYMAPEQHLGHDVDATADQFAFCVTLYEALCGRPPHSPDGKGIKAAIIASEIREPPRHSPMPRALRRIVWRGLAADPADRYPSMKALLLDLRKRRGVRRRVVALTAGALVLGGASVAVLGPDAAPQPCTGADAKLAEVWGDPHRAQLRAAFEATQRPDAELSASGVQLRFDDYGVAWRAMYEDACLATHVRKEQSAATLDLRMECLDTRRRQLGALVAALIRAEATALDQAPVAAAKLPPLSVCSDAQALRDRLPMPGDPAVRTEIAELRERMAHAAALQAIGELVEALKLMEPVAAR
ncbi:MAG: serine/threonine-protein kinase, partial [Myxococcota bacterium]